MSMKKALEKEIMYKLYKDLSLEYKEAEKIADEVADEILCDDEFSNFIAETIEKKLAEAKN